MAEQGQDYITKVGMDQGADVLFVREDGQLKFFDIDFSGLFMRNYIASSTMKGVEFTSVVLSNLNSQVASVGTIVAALSNSIPGGAWNFDLATTNSLFSMSCPIASGYSGCILKLLGHSVIGDANVILLAGSVAGASLTGLGGTDLSSLNLSAGFFVEMHATGNSEWTIINRNGSATEQASA